MLTDTAQALVRQILEDAAGSRGPKPGALEEMVGNYFTAFMDTQRIERLGMGPLRPDLGLVRVATREQIAGLMGPPFPKLHREHRFPH
jgi:putative endopeptidase